MEITEILHYVNVTIKLMYIHVDLQTLTIKIRVTCSDQIKKTQFFFFVYKTAYDQTLSMATLAAVGIHTFVAKANITGREACQFLLLIYKMTFDTWYGCLFNYTQPGHGLIQILVRGIELSFFILLKCVVSQKNLYFSG